MYFSIEYKFTAKGKVPVKLLKALLKFEKQLTKIQKFQNDQILMEEHEKWMRWCLDLAQQALQQGDFPVGAVVVKEGKLIGQGVEASKTKKDITCHAEIEAIRDARQTINSANLGGCILYTTHEPCIMCSYVIRHYKISQVVLGTTVSEVGGLTSEYSLLNASNISIWGVRPHVVQGVLVESCQALNQAYEQKFKN